MKRSRIFILALIPVVLVIFGLGFFLFVQLSEDPASSVVNEESSPFMNLGVTYLPLTPGLSTYYNLGVNFGALVTEVASSSIAEKAGVQVGDVILSFNGTRVDDGTSLLGMIMACPEDSSIMLEVWRGQDSRVIGLAHTEIREVNR